MSAALIRAVEVGYAYPDGTEALRGIDFELGEREFVAFVGQNGSGKTTFAKCLNGLFVPTVGKVLVEGLDTGGRGLAKQIVTRVGYVFQNPDHQLFNQSVWSEIAYGPRNLGMAAGEVEERVREAAGVAGIRQELFSEHPFFLPKGLRQRVAIASILAFRPRTIIVDEPTTGQDPRQSLEIMSFLKRLQEDEGHTVVIITHEMPIVAAFAARTVVFHEGRALLDGPTREVFAQAEVLARTRVFPPQVTRLAGSLARFGLPPDMLTVEEMEAALSDRLRERARG